MGNAITVQKETKAGRLKTMIRTLERHRRAITQKAGRVNRELSLIEGRLRKSMSRSQAASSRVSLAGRMYDSSAQLAQEIIFKRSQVQDLNSILCKIDSMQQTVTRIYLCIHKRQILRSISTGIEKIDIAEMEKIAKEDTDKLEHQLLFDNVQTVQKLNISADTTISALEQVEGGSDSHQSETRTTELENVLKEFKDEHANSIQKTVREQQLRMEKIKASMSPQAENVRG